MGQGQTTNEDILKAENDRLERERSLAREDLSEIMASKAGRRFMYRHIFIDCHLQDVYVAQDSGVYKHEGRRGVGADLAILLQTEHTDAYILMITERLLAMKYERQVRDRTREMGDET